MAKSLLEALEAQSMKLSRDEQLELARRLLNHSLVTEAPEGRYSILDLIGAGQGTWKTAEEVDRYIEEERSSWGP